MAQPERPPKGTQPLDEPRPLDRVDRESYREGYRDALRDQSGAPRTGPVLTPEDELAAPSPSPSAVAEPPAEAPPAAPPGKASRWVLLLAGVALVGGLAWYFQSHKSAQEGTGKPGEAASAGGGKGPADRVVPVIAAPVQQRDVAVTLSGLGAVTPLQSVALKSQVDGRLQSVTFTEGQAVKKGDVLAQVDARAYVIQQHQAEAALQRDQATLRNARLQLERNVSLVHQQLLAKQALDDQQTVVDQTEAAVKSDQAAVEQARLLQDYARIVAPIDGVTGIRQVDPGNLVHASDATGIVVISQLDPIAVVFTLPQDDLPQVAAAMAQGPLAVDAFSRDGTTLLGTGTLALVDNQVNAATSTIKLKASFANPQRALWPSAFVKARLHVSVHKDALVVPTPAIQHGPKGTFVYVVGDDRTARMQPVELLSTEGDDAIVTQLQPGQLVVTDGQAQLKPGSKLSLGGKDKERAAGGAPAEAGADGGAPAGGHRRRGAP
jgi:multidrug efflux system membrane fusion protein